MKTVLLVLFLNSLGMLHAQERWLIGSGITYCTRLHHPGINVSINRIFLKRIVTSAEVSAILTREKTNMGRWEKHKELEYTFFTQYLIGLTSTWNIYPLAGFNVSKVTRHLQGEFPDKRWLTSVLFGSGVEYDQEGRRIKPFAEFFFIHALNKYDFTAGVLVKI